MNPFFSIWTSPRRTADEFIGNDSRISRLHLITALLGMVIALWVLASVGIEHFRLSYFIIAILMSPVAGVLFVRTGAFLFYQVIMPRPVELSQENIKTIMVLSSVPLVWGLVLWIPWILIAGNAMFTGQNIRLLAEQSMVFGVMFLVLILLELVLMAWSFATFVIIFSYAGKTELFRSTYITLFFSMCMWGIIKILILITGKF